MSDRKEIQPRGTKYLYEIDTKVRFVSDSQRREESLDKKNEITDVLLWHLLCCQMHTFFSQLI